MTSDLPPGVRGPIPNPSVEAEKNRNKGIVEAYPIAPRPTLSVYATQFFVYTLHYPAIKLKSFIESRRSPNKRRYYHEKFRRVPDIWECKTDDLVCVFEAEVQYQRDKLVDSAILELIENRKEFCRSTYPHSWEETCKPVIDEFLATRKNWHIKYAEMGVHQNARNTLNKQKNRFIEKRYKERIGVGYNEDWIVQDWAQKK